MSLKLSRLSVRAPDGATLFAGLDLTVVAGEVATVTGPSGAGKSTLLDAIGGHLSPGFHVTGRVFLDGRDVTDLPAEARGIGVMFQQAVLFPHLSVADNLAFGLSPAIRGRVARRMAVADARPGHVVGRAARAGGVDAHPAGRSQGSAAGRTVFGA